MNTPFSIPEDLLRQSSKLSSRLDNGPSHNQLYLGDLTEAVGHVMIHFLHTGVYQCLRPDESSLIETTTAEFITSVRVYAAARVYGIPLLAKQAAREVESLSKSLDIRTILSVLEEGYPHPSVDDTWILHYLKTRIRGLLDRPETSIVGEKCGQIETSIAQLCVQSIMDISQETRGSGGSVKSLPNPDPDKATSATALESLPSPSEHSVSKAAVNCFEEPSVPEPVAYHEEPASDPEAETYTVEELAEEEPAVPEYEDCPVEELLVKATVSASDDEAWWPARSSTKPETFFAPTALDEGPENAEANPDILVPVEEIQWNRSTKTKKKNVLKAEMMRLAYEEAELPSCGESEI